MLNQAIYALERRAETVKANMSIYENLQDIKRRKELKHLYNNNVQELESIEEALEILTRTQVLNELLYP